MKRDRQTQIEQLFLQKKRVSIKELCDTFDISVETARRDLNKLEADGLVRRVYGGAVLVDAVEDLSTLPPWDYRFEKNTNEKNAIARQILEIIPDRSTIFLDSGTSAFEIAKLLRTKSNLTILTNDLRIASELSTNTTHTIYCIGGLVKQDELMTTGFLALDFLERFSQIDIAVLSADGLDVNVGLTEHNVEMGTIKSAIISKSHKVFVGVDHSKFSNSAFYRVCTIDKLTTVVTSDMAPQESINVLENTGVQTIRVKISST